MTLSRETPELNVNPPLPLVKVPLKVAADIPFPSNPLDIT